LKGIICSDLYSVEEERSLTSNTQAVKELVDGAIAQGLNVEVVFRFFPIVTKRGIFWPRKRRINGILVCDIPKVGVRYCYSKLLTSLVVRLLGISGKWDFAVCHMVSNYEAAKKTLNDRIGKVILVAHQSDLRSDHLAWALKTADGVLARSQAVAHQIQLAQNVKVDGVVWSGLAKNIFAKKSVIENKSGASLELMTACNLIPLKNVLNSVRAFSKLKELEPSARFTIYGDGILMKDLRHLIVELGLEDSVSVKGFRPKQEVIECMRRAHIFVMPSAPETLGLAYLEAMASGCVVIGHKGWGIDGIVKDGESGFLVDEAGPEDIFEKMKRCVNRQAWLAIADRSFEIVQRHGMEDSAHNYMKLVLKYAS